VNDWQTTKEKLSIKAITKYAFLYNEQSKKFIQKIFISNCTKWLSKTI